MDELMSYHQDNIAVSVFLYNASVRRFSYNKKYRQAF